MSGIFLVSVKTLSFSRFLNQIYVKHTQKFDQLRRNCILKEKNARTETLVGWNDLRFGENRNFWLE